MFVILFCLHLAMVCETWTLPLFGFLRRPVIKMKIKTQHFGERIGPRPRVKD